MLNGFSIKEKFTQACPSLQNCGVLCETVITAQESQGASASLHITSDTMAMIPFEWQRLTQN